MIMKPMPVIGLKMDFVPPFLNASHIRHSGAIFKNLHMIENDRSLNIDDECC